MTTYLNFFQVITPTAYLYAKGPPTQGHTILLTFLSDQPVYLYSKHEKNFHMQCKTSYSESFGPTRIYWSR